MNSAHSGDTILVEPGTYVGNIDISKSSDLNNLVLMSASGNPADTIIIANNSAPVTVLGVISILKYKINVTVKGFTISGARDSMAGVYLDHGTNCTIKNNVFTNGGFEVNVLKVQVTSLATTLSIELKQLLMARHSRESILITLPIQLSLKIRFQTRIREFVLQVPVLEEAAYQETQ